MWVIVECSRRFWMMVQRKEKQKKINKVRHLLERGHDKEALSVFILQGEPSAFVSCTHIKVSLCLISQVTLAI